MIYSQTTELEFLKSLRALTEHLRLHDPMCYVVSLEATWKNVQWKLLEILAQCPDQKDGIATESRDHGKVLYQCCKALQAHCIQVFA